MLEKDIERRLRRKAKAAGCRCLKFVCPGYTGVPDRIILIPGGQVIFVELKAPGKKERPRQAVVQNMLRRMGFKVYSSVDSADKVDQVAAECAHLALRNEWARDKIKEFAEKDGWPEPKEDEEWWSIGRTTTNDTSLTK